MLQLIDAVVDDGLLGVELHLLGAHLHHRSLKLGDSLAFSLACVVGVGS
jgi:hypothetical protein